VLIERVTSARLAGHDGLCDLVLRGDRVAAIEPPSGSVAPAVLDAGGRVVVSAFVDAHVHLDKAFLLDEAAALGPCEPRLEAAIATVDRLRKELDLEAVQVHAEEAVATLARQGVVAARAHVEVVPDAEVDLLDLHLGLAEGCRDLLDLQLVAFPQLGLQRPGAVDRLGAAMRGGATVVGGCPYVDDDAAAHLDAVFALADRHGAPVDLHLDFADDPTRSQLELVIERTDALGMRGQVTVGHCTTLAAFGSDRRREAFDRLAASGIALVVLPVTDLYLGGQGDPGTRSLAPIDQAAAAGVRVAIANNNLANPFAPFGNGSLVQAAWLAGVTRRLGSASQRQVLLDAITVVPAEILGRPPHGPTVGSVADLVLLDTADPGAAVSQAPAVLATIRQGHLR
jgi:cytosine deaminase